MTAAGELSLDAAVVSAGALAGRLDGIGRVMVRRGAVITPAARDLLKEKKIDVSFRVAPKDDTKTVRLLIGAADTGFRPYDLIRLLFRKPVTIEQIAESELIRVIEQLAHHLSDPVALGLLLTAQVAAAACLANRLPGVRAVAAGDSTAIASAIRHVGANLLVLDPAHRSPFALKQLVERFIHGGARSCPEQWRDRLK